MARLIQANPCAETVSVSMPSEGITEAHFLERNFGPGTAQSSEIRLITKLIRARQLLEIGVGHLAHKLNLSESCQIQFC
jgi:hypothetical protein